MAQRRRRGTARSTLDIGVNKFSQELRGIILEEGMEILGEIAKMVADEANRLAPTFDIGTEGPRRPQKWKSRADPKGGPIKGSVFAQRSHKLPGTWLVCSPAYYSHFVEYGTNAHEMPRAKWQKEIGTDKPHVMTAKIGGNFIHFDWAYHPGSKQTKFLRPAADKAEQFLLEILKKRYGV